jgi:hypothetical protein
MTRIIFTSVALLCMVTTGAVAKGHDQGNTTVPGAEDVGSFTVTVAQTLGSGKGNRPEGKGPGANNPAAGNAGR